jgi:hypothetical protein
MRGSSVKTEQDDDHDDDDEDDQQCLEHGDLL